MKSTRRITLVTLLLLLGWAASTHAQKPQLSIECNAGAWRPFVRSESVYAANSQRWQPQAGLGMGIGFRITESLSLTTQIGLAYNGLRHMYGSTRDDRTIDSRLGLLYGRLSPGLTLKPLKFVAIRLGLGMLGSLWTLGEYSITTYNNGAFSKVSYTDRFSRIRNPFLIGPELSIGVDIPIQKSRVLSLCLTGFVTKGSVFRAGFNTLFNPRIAQLNLGMAYTFSHKSQ